MGGVPEWSEREAERQRRSREAARRRTAVTMLQITEATCRYAASQLSNGTGPDEARETALFVAGELAMMAETLRRLTRLRPDERREMARRLAGLGWPKRQIAARLGISERSVWRYVQAEPVSRAGR
jgi:DNA-directed RNA polymerase specialized sigma24 family protein